MSIWAASLHLTYNNFLILLHRPHPRATRRSDDHGPNDSEICSSAACAVASIFEELRQKDQIKYLWISDINALFTAMIQVSVELRFSNPVLAINALRRFDSTLFSLRMLAEYWINAESILRLFEESSHVQHGIRLGKGKSKDRAHTQSSNPLAETALAANDLSVPDTSYNMDKTTDLYVLAAVAHAAGGHTESSNASAQLDQNGWEDLFPQNDMSSNDLAMGVDLLPLDSEWRQIYWQEPGIAGSFPDGFWGWP